MTTTTTREERAVVSLMAFGLILLTLIQIHRCADEATTPPPYVQPVRSGHVH